MTPEKVRMGLNGFTVKELRALAKKYNADVMIRGYSTMKKADLVDAMMEKEVFKKIKMAPELKPAAKKPAPQIEGEDIDDLKRKLKSLSRKVKESLSLEKLTELQKEIESLKKEADKLKVSFKVKQEFKEDADEVKVRVNKFKGRGQRKAIEELEKKKEKGKLSDVKVTRGPLAGITINPTPKPLTEAEKKKRERDIKEMREKREAEISKRDKELAALSPKAKKNTKLLFDNFTESRTREGTKIIKQVLKDMVGDKKFIEYNLYLLEKLPPKYKKLIEQLMK